MRLAFMGTPDFAAVSLGELLAAQDQLGVTIEAVYTRKPKPAGRGKTLQKSPVHRLAEEAGLPVHTPGGFRKNPDARAAFSALDLDGAIVVAYGLLLPPEVLAAPRLGCFNLHGSLLPRWRGAAPIQRAIMAGDEATGVQVMRMEEGLDTGPILLSETTPIHNDDTAQTLHDRLAHIGAGLLPRFLAALQRGGVVETPQAEDGVLYAEKISPAEARIDWAKPARLVDCHIRGLSPFPGAWFEVAVDSEKTGKNNGETARIKALLSTPAPTRALRPGQMSVDDNRIFVGCGDGAVELLRLQRAGKKAQEAPVFLRGFDLTNAAIVDL